VVVLIPLPVEIATVVAVVVIVAILAVYVSILKKNGWIGETNNYRCPNPQCKKIFQVPVKVKDFSTEREVGFACPECGCDLGSINSEKDPKETTPQKKPETKNNDLPSNLIRNEELALNVCSKEPQAPSPAPPIVKSKKTTNHIKEQSSLKQKLEDPKKDGPEGCKQYFGFLGSATMDSEPLDNCYFCPKLIECSEKVIQTKSP